MENNKTELNNENSKVSSVKSFLELEIYFYTLSNKDIIVPKLGLIQKGERGVDILSEDFASSNFLEISSKIDELLLEKELLAKYKVNIAPLLLIVFAIFFLLVLLAITGIVSENTIKSIDGFLLGVISANLYYLLYGKIIRK